MFHLMGANAAFYDINALLLCTKALGQELLKERIHLANLLLDRLVDPALGHQDLLQGIGEGGLNDLCNPLHNNWPVDDDIVIKEWAPPMIFADLPKSHLVVDRKCGNIALISLNKRGLVRIESIEQELGCLLLDVVFKEVSARNEGRIQCAQHRSHVTSRKQVHPQAFSKILPEVPQDLIQLLRITRLLHKRLHFLKRQLNPRVQLGNLGRCYVSGNEGLTLGESCRSQRDSRRGDTEGFARQLVVVSRGEWSKVSDVVFLPPHTFGSRPKGIRCERYAPYF